MNLYEDASLEPKLDELSDQLGLLVLDLLLADLQELRRQTRIYQDFAEVKGDTQPRNPPF
jgi:hypothetical protein